ncbi:MAG TPA: hypothetical protein VG102_01390, partial [Candidatus Paceibacterota bacterium]|nr:hypothetical protein [Candidatus Paceibacterota bacterium]
MHHWIGAYCYVPVEYQSGAYELIRVLLVDDDPVDVQIERVNPAKGWIRRGIAKSSKMPEITICEPGMLVLHVVDRAGAREDKGDEVIDWNITLSASIGGS